MSRLTVSVLCAVLGVSGVASAADSAEEEVIVWGSSKKPASPSLKLKVDNFELNTKRYVFPSGLRVFFQVDQTLPIAAITSVTDHGSGSDPLGMEGMAHLYEHLWFRTEHGELPSTWGLLQNELGCNLNAFTNFDVTTYMTVCPSGNLEHMMRLESLRMTAPMGGVPDDGVTTEIEVVRNEIRNRSENGNIPFFSLLEPMGKHTYPEDHPYHRPIAGDHTTVRSITPDDLRSWTADMYRPEHTTVMLVGDFDPDRALDLLIENFDLSLFGEGLTEEHVVRWPRRGVKSPDPENPDHWRLVLIDPADPEGKRPLNVQMPLAPRAEMYKRAPLPAPNPEFGRFEGTVDDPTVMVTWTLPPAYQGYDTLNRMLGNVLSFIVGGELDDPGFKEFGGCGALDGKFATMMVCSATIKDTERAERLAEMIVDQVATMWNPDLRPLLDRSFARARNELMAGVFRSLDLFSAVGSGRATDIAGYAHFTDDPKYHSTQIKEANTITAGNMAQVASQWLVRERVNMLLVEPRDRDELKEESEEGESDHYGSKKVKGTNGLVMPEEITEERVRELAYTPDMSKVVEYKLQNGMNVVIVPNGQAPVVNATLIMRGGSANDADGNMSFVERFSRADGEDALRIAGQWGGGRGSTYQTMSLEGSSGNLNGIMWMMRDRIEDAHPDLANRPDYIKRGKKRIIKNYGDIDWHIGDIMRQHVNPGHPAVLPSTYEDYDRWGKINGKYIKDDLARRYHPRNSTLLVVGRFTVDEAQTAVNKYWGTWSPLGDVYEASDVPAPNEGKEKRVVLFDDEDKTQTTVQLRCPVRYDGGTQSPAHQILGTVLGNEAFATLREAAGVVYSPAGFVMHRPGEAWAVFSADVQNDAAAFTLQTYWDILGEIEAGNYDEDQVKQEKYAAALKTVLSKQSNRQLSGAYTGALATPDGLKAWDVYADKLSKVTAKELGNVLSGCIDHSITYLRGPKDTIAPLLDEQEIPYEVIDWEQRGRDLHKAQDPKDFEKAEEKRLKAEAKKEAEEAEKAAEEGEGDEDADADSEETAEEDEGSDDEGSGDEES